MSPVTSLAKPLARPIAPCPYCEHVSPAESKFCNECGAALHLVPCPHCGAVNDITVTTACYRCHGELRANVSTALPAPAAAAPAAPESVKAEKSPYVISGPPARQRLHALVVGFVLIAFAAASYYAYRQRSALDVREPGQAEVKDRATPADSNANTGAGTIIKAPADAVPNPAPAAPIATAAPVEAKPHKLTAEPSREATTAPDPIATTATTAPTASVRSRAGKSAAGREATESPAVAVIATPENTRARVDASKGLEKQQPNIGPCTDAVAALGLCTPEPTPRRQ